MDSQHKRPGPCITNVIATCRKNFGQWERSFLWKLRCHWLKFLRRVAKTLVIQGPVTPKVCPCHGVVMVCHRVATEIYICRSYWCASLWRILKIIVVLSLIFGGSILDDSINNISVSDIANISDAFTLDDVTWSVVAFRSWPDAEHRKYTIWSNKCQLF